MSSELVTSARRRGRRERREHVRRTGSEVSSIRTARLKHGPSVSLIDLSAGGALIETDIQMKPGVTVALEIVSSGEQSSLVPMRILRCEVATLHPATRYRGACVFSRLLQIPELIPEPIVPAPPVRPFIGLDGSLKVLAERYRGGTASLKTPDVLQVLRTLHARAAHLDEDGIVRPIADLLLTVALALERQDPAADVLATIEARLREALPKIDIRLADGPLPSSKSESETIVLRPEQATDLACVLSVQLPSGSTLDDWQFRLLKASMHLCSLLDAAGVRGTDATSVAGSLWQKIVVRYKDGRLVKGFSHDFHPTRSQFAIWPSINSPEHDGIVVPVSGLKAVFFVRDFRGDSEYVEDKTFDQASPGRRIEVTFFDNEVLVGTTLSYRPDGHGFFLSPADPNGNNVRVFVVTSAVRHVRFLGNTTEPAAGRLLQLAAG